MGVFKFLNFKIFKYSACLAIAFWLLIILPSKADANVIINRPLAIGLNQGLVGHWTFDGKDMNRATGTAYDISGNGNNGTLTNGPKPTIGKIGQALEFDGSDDYVDAGSASNLDNISPISISSWVKLDTITSGDGDVFVDKDCTASGIGCDNGWTFRAEGFYATRGITFFRRGTTLMRVTSNNNTLLTDVWQHVAVTHDGMTAANTHIYLNGREVSYQAQENGAAAVDDSGMTLKVGGGGPSRQLIDGLIDDVRVYNRVLSADEVKRLYNLGGTFTINKSQSTGTLKDGLVGHWTFDGKDMNRATGTAYDISGNGNNGTLTNGPKPTIGKIGQALEFDGSNDYVSMGDVLDFENTNTFSVSAWVYLDSLSGEPQIVTKQNNVSPFQGWTFDISSSLLRLQLINTVTTNHLQVRTNTTLTTKRWFHAVVTYNGSLDASGVNIYIDGLVTADSTTVNTLSATTLTAFPLQIGARNGANYPTDGLIDDVRVYNRVLSADEVKRLYNLGRTFVVNKTQSTGTLKDGLVGHWAFDGPTISGATVFDLSPEADNGTMTNGTVPGAIGRIGQALLFKELNSSTDAYVTMGDTAVTDFAGDFSISLWLKHGGQVEHPIGTSDGWNVIQKEITSPTADGYQCRVNDSSGGVNGTIEFSLNADGSAPPSSMDGIKVIKDGQWHHLICMRSGSTAFIYIDGVSDNSAATETQAITPTTSLEISDDGTSFDGLIDDVRVYNRALSPDEIKRLYNKGR